MKKHRTARRSKTPLALALVALPSLQALALAQQPFDQCGTIEAGVTCSKMFRSDDQRLWVLDTSLTGVQVGDRVRVTGTEDPTCITICQQGDGCIVNSQLAACGLIGLLMFCQGGLPNSLGLNPYIEAFGSLTVADNDLTLTCVGVPAGEFAMFVVSRDQVPPVIANGAAGALCLGGSIARLQAQVGAADASGRYTISTDPAAGAQRFDLLSFPTSATTIAPIFAGETFHFQVWHRDNSGTQQAIRSAFSSGISLTFG